jgi:hypothetical protein
MPLQLPFTKGAPRVESGSNGSGMPGAKPWGAPGVAERYHLADDSISIAPSGPGGTNATLKPAGILTEVWLHANSSITLTHGTGTNAKDIYGYSGLYQSVGMKTSPTLATIAASGHMLALLQFMEQPNGNYETSPDPDTIINPLTNASDGFNYPLATGVFRFWQQLPIAIRLAGVPGGIAGPLILQNKRVTNTINLVFGVSGAASPFSFASAAGFGNAPYNITGNDTITGTGVIEPWKTLYTVPDDLRSFPVLGLMRQISEVIKPYSGSGFSYDYEPGGGVLRTLVQVEDATVKGGVATLNVQDIIFRYGLAHTTYNESPFFNIRRQREVYGSVLGQGVYVVDFYTQSRSLRDVQAAENLAAMQLHLDFASTYVVPANSQVRMLIDKAVTVATTIGK